MLGRNSPTPLTEPVLQHAKPAPSDDDSDTSDEFAEMDEASLADAKHEAAEEQEQQWDDMMKQAVILAPYQTMRQLRDATHTREEVNEAIIHCITKISARHQRRRLSSS
jgi:hypothetical protein